MQIFCDVAQPMGLFQGDTETTACLRNGGDDELDSWISIHIVVVTITLIIFTMKTAVLSLLVAGASAFAPASQVRRKNFMDRERFWTKKLTLVVFVSLPDLEASL